MENILESVGSHTGQTDVAIIEHAEKRGVGCFVVVPSLVCEYDGLRIRPAPDKANADNSS